MERGIEQYFIFAAIIFATLLDLFVRFVRNRSRGQKPPAEPDDPYFDDEAEFEMLQREQLEREQIARERFEREQVQLEQVAQTQLEREREIAQSWEREPPVSRDAAPADRRPVIVARQPTPVPTPTPRVASAASRAAMRAPMARKPAMDASRGARGRRLIRNAADARRGIVMMTILGPCRGLEQPPRG